MTEHGATLPALATLEIEPLDVLFCGGGRSLGPTARVQSGAPTPQVVAGALRTWLLRRTGADLVRLGAAIRSGADFISAAAEQGEDVARVGLMEFRGPWFTSEGQRLVRTPNTVHEENDGASTRARRLCRLDPLRPETDAPGWPSGSSSERPLWRRSTRPSKPRGDYLLPCGLRLFLDGGIPRPEHVLDEAKIFRIEPRHGIGVDARRNTAEEGLIYQIGALRLARGVRMEVDIVGAGDDLDVLPDRESSIALGGEGRRAVVRCRQAPPRRPRNDSLNGDGRLVLLTTAGLFDGWKPSGLDLIAAAVPGNEPVSGWDLALGGPKRTRFAIPAGSVYFLAAGSCPPPTHGVLSPGAAGAAGWGAFEDGEWSYA